MNFEQETHLSQRNRAMLRVVNGKGKGLDTCYSVTYMSQDS